MQEALFVSEQEKVLQDLDKMATKTELQDFRQGIREEVISAVYQDILRDSSVGCTKRYSGCGCGCGRGKPELNTGSRGFTLLVVQEGI